MNIQEIKAGEITAEIVEQQSSAWKQAVEDTKAAAAAYIQDIENRKAALAKRAAEYQSQADELRTARNKAADQVADLTSRGRFDEAAAAECEVEKLDNSISMLERKLRLVNSAEMKGDPGYYKAAKQAHETAEEARSVYNDALSHLYTTAKAEVSRLREVMDRISNLLNYVRNYAPDDGFHKVDRHFRDLARIEREAKERWQAEQDAKKNQRKGNTQVVIPQ